MTLTNFQTRRPFLVLITAILSVSFVAQSFTLADLPTQAEANAWLQRIRNERGWPGHYDVKEDAMRKELLTRKGLLLRPDSRGLKRDLADALHVLGHFAEYDHDFEKALQYHRESLILYRQANLPTRESWNDGVDHAEEHIFLDIYDEGWVYEQSDDHVNAKAKYDEALAWSQKNNLDKKLMASNRFVPRYLDLLRRTGTTLRDFSVQAYQSTSAACDRVLQQVANILRYYNIR